VLIVVLVIVGVLILAVIGLIVLRIFAGQVVGLALSRTRVRIKAIDGSRMTFQANKYTEAEGRYFVRWGATASARVGAITGRAAGGVTREVTFAAEAPVGATSADWSGQYFSGPHEVGTYDDVVIQTSEGEAPAWYFPGAPSSADWVIHVHGIRVTRLSPLRGVDAIRSTGAHSLVISYRGDTEGPAHPYGTSTLGVSEWPDIEPAINYAKTRGARRIFLMGWSMGAGMTLLASERASNRDDIDGLILIGPVTDWRATIVHGARAAGVPARVGKLVTAALSHRFSARLLGAGHPIDFDALDWAGSPGRLSTPCLVLHSPTDDEVPFELSERFAASNPGVTLKEQPGALHTLEWNRSAESFEAAVTSWLADAN